MTATRNFRELLGLQEEAGKRVCVGLDPDYGKIPAVIRESFNDPREVILRFNRAIVEATKDIVLAYKPNRAFYEAQGILGLLALRDTVEFILREAPEVPVILDAKYGDIDNTNIGYATFVFDQLHADAVTLNPYLGGPETLKPFLRSDKGAIVLCRTSNKEASVFQDRMVQTDAEMTPLYKVVAQEVSEWSHEYPGCALVVGATHPEELTEVREIVGDDMPLLIPGIGAQGGELEATVRAGRRHMIINSSRGIIFASDGLDYADAARTATQKLQDDIEAALTAIA